MGEATGVTKYTIGLAALTLIGLALMVFYTPNSVALPAVLILISLGIFILLMIYTATSLKQAGMFDVTQPFGMPPGTIRAILTISFIILVGVFGSLVLLKSSGRSALVPVADLQKVTMDKAYAASLEKLGNDMVVVTTPILDGSGSIVDKDKVLVSVFAKADYQASDDIAKTIIGMLSTLLAAMIGFYFGARIDVPGQEWAKGDLADETALQNQIDEANKELTKAETKLQELANQLGQETDEAKKKTLNETHEELKTSIADAQKAVGSAKQLEGKMNVPALRREATLNKLRDAVAALKLKMQ